MATTVEDKIQRFLEETFLLTFDDDLTEDSDLFKRGIIDSFGYIQLIKYLEREFAIKFSEDEMLSNVLVSFTNIVESVTKKIQSGVPL